MAQTGKVSARHTLHNQAAHRPRFRTFSRLPSQQYRVVPQRTLDDPLFIHITPITMVDDLRANRPSRTVASPRALTDQQTREEQTVWPS